MKTIKDLKELISECRVRLQNAQSLPSEEYKKVSSKISEEIKYYQSMVYLPEQGYNESKLSEWRLSLQNKLDLIESKKPKMEDCYNNYTIHKRLVNEHYSSCGKSKIVSQIRDIDFILNK